MKQLFSSLVILLFLSSNILYSQTTFNYTGAVQTYVVPECVSTILVDLKGAEGSSQAAAVSPAGKGGRVQATLDVIPGTSLKIFVGGAGVAGSAAAGGYNGGGGTGTGTGGTGGGASDIRIGGIELENRIIVAAGGGGAGGTYDANNNGGNGGGLIGKNGFQAGSYNSAYCGAGGTSSNGGKGPSTAYNGNLGVGGIGGAHGGGGGGGYFGGGGGAGAIVCCTGGGGGGGSSFADSNFTSDVVHTAGVQTSNGQVIITVGLNGAPRPGLIIGNDSVCIGQKAYFYVDPIESVTSYDWVFPEETTIDSGQGTNHVLVHVGQVQGNISLTTTNSCGLSKPRTKLFIPITCINPDTTIGFMNNTKKLEFSVYPNPANELLNIEINRPELNQLKIELINSQGSLMYSSFEGQTKGNYIKTINLNSIPKGIYFIRIFEKDTFSVKKISIQ